uniref:NADH dehydrogenase subunit 4L n=1 Tax=Megalophaedusa schmackeri TaxID=1885716 RepID=A0A224ABC2_9EUPU|nr:NADH dehydrogenase subunit 4L [Megalophaedusa schmackeri]
MTILILLFSLFMFLVRLFLATKVRYLSALLLLESMVLVSLVFVLFILSMTASSLNLFILLLALAVCEAGLALSLLMSVIKISSSNLIHLYNSSV